MIQVPESEWQRRYILFAEKLIEKAQERHDSDNAVAVREHEREICAIRAVIQKRVEQRFRLEGMRSAIGRVWETESALWEELWATSKDELVHIKKEEVALENQIARCGDKFMKRQETAERNLKQEIKNYRDRIRTVRYMAANGE
jgi:hypothetical protein